MKYFIGLYGEGDLGPWEELTAEQQEAAFGQFGAFDEACAQADGVEILNGEALEEGSMATTLRSSGGEWTVTDGPFAEAAEQIGGYYVIEAPNLDTIIGLCQILPAYDIEIRPVVDMPE